MALLLSMLLAASPSPAAALNTEGYRLYQAGKFEKALEKFRAAVDADSQHALSHYNLAATLGVMRKQNKVCEMNAYVWEVLDHLEASVRLDPKRRARMVADADFDATVRSTVRFLLLSGLSVSKDAAKILTTVSWYGPSGARGPTASVTFLADGTFSLSMVVSVDDDDNPLRESFTGTVKVEGASVTLRFSRPPAGTTQRVFTGRLISEGRLIIDGLSSFTDTLSECEV
jgi:tetratricopeptide (TPR) repeat protein